MNRFFLALVALLFLAFTPGYGQGSITVTGEATSYNLPSDATLVLYVSNLEKDADDAFDETADDVTDMVQEMQELKYVTRINVSDMSIEPAYDRVNMRYGFRSYQEVSISIDSLAVYEDLLEDLLGMGADGIASAPTMGKDQEKIDMELLKDAVRNARAKAESLASAENMRVGKVLSMEVIAPESDKSNISVEKSTVYTGFNSNKRVNRAMVRVSFALN